MISCKRCKGSSIFKNGKTRNKQRYRCRNCSYNFVLGDKRAKEFTAIKRAFAVIMYSLGKASYGFIAKLFGVTPPAVLKWIRKEAALLREPKITTEIREIEIDEMWHFIQSKKTKNGSSKPWTVLAGKGLPGLQVIVALQRSESSIVN